MTVLAYEIMTPSIKAVPQSWTMDRLARFLTDNEITGSPVTDDDGEIVGIATLKDITEFRWNATRSDADRHLTPEEREEARQEAEEIANTASAYMSDVFIPFSDAAKAAAVAQQRYGPERAKRYEEDAQEYIEEAEKRQSQIGSGGRSERIRTYNFPQDRITDHRINENWHHIEEIMNGSLDQITSTLKESEEEEIVQ